MNACEYIEKYHQSPRIDQLPREEEIYLETRRIDINNEGFMEDVSFEPGQYGYKTYSGFTFRNQRGEEVTFKGTISRKQDNGWGFRIFEFEGRVYKELPMLDITYIDRDKEKMACESVFNEDSEGKKTLTKMKIIQ